MIPRTLIFVAFVALATAPPAANAQPTRNRHRFPDFNKDHLPPNDVYSGALFRLSQNYPLALPDQDVDIKAILAIPYDKNEQEQNWLKYLLAVRAYCFEGNLKVNWRGQENETRKWYHVPWQHVGEKGREGINGLTREATAQPKQLAQTQKDKFDTHAVAMYSSLGGYTIGRVWLNMFEPDPAASLFPDGTVVVKLLFTQADEKQVPYLKNPITWKGYVRQSGENPLRSVQDLQLLQMDIMVRDPRANETGGWVFGTYCYNGALNKENRWENLVPVGIQWGNDPDVDDPKLNPETPAPLKTAPNARLKQTIINPSDELPPQHLGWGGRLNGPADYYRSSCMSCHSTAQFPSVVEQHPDFDKPMKKYQPGDPQWSAYFRNLKCGEAFVPAYKYDDRKAISTDYSLQLAIGITQFYQWKQNVMGGYFTPVLPDAPRQMERSDLKVPTSEAR